MPLSCLKPNHLAGFVWVFMIAFAVSGCGGAGREAEHALSKNREQDAIAGKRIGLGCADQSLDVVEIHNAWEVAFTPEFNPISTEAEWKEYSRSRRHFPWDVPRIDFRSRSLISCRVHLMCNENVGSMAIYSTGKSIQVVATILEAWQDNFFGDSTSKTYLLEVDRIDKPVEFIAKRWSSKEIEPRKLPLR